MCKCMWIKSYRVTILNETSLVLLLYVTIFLHNMKFMSTIARQLGGI